MAIRFSPGCGCCLGKCEEITLQWIPSSPYDRGEYTDDDRWRPFTEYLQGDRFWQFALDRNGDSHRFLFEAPATMFSGGGWTLTEESRYNRLQGISYNDRLDDFYLIGDRWASDQIELHEYLQEKKLQEGQGLVSVREVVETDWAILWFPTISSVEEYDSFEMPTVHVDIQLLGNVEHEVDSQLPPSSGILTSIKKATPNQRQVGPYPESCIPSCEALTGTIWNPDDPECGNKPPYKIEVVARHGTMSNLVENLSNHYRPAGNRVDQIRSFQPQNGAVTGPLDIKAELAQSGETSVDLHDQSRRWADHSIILHGDTKNPYLQNQVLVATTSGKVNTGETIIDLEAGDIIRVDDFTKVGDNLDAAFEIIAAADIVEDERTHCSTPKTVAERIYDNTSIEVATNLASFTGKRVAIYVKDFRDENFTRTRNGDYSVKFGQQVCRIEDVATVSNPTCTIVPAWECECEELSLLIATPAEIDAAWKYEYCRIFDGGIVEPGFGDVWTVASNSGGPVWSEPFAVATVDGRCHGKASELILANSWTVQNFGQVFNGREFASSYGIAAAVTAVFQYSEIRTFDCISKQDKAVMARSVVAYINSNIVTGFNLNVDDGSLGIYSQDEAEALIQEAIRAQQLYMATLLNAFICRGWFKFNDDMDTWEQSFPITENNIDLSNGATVRFGWTPAFITNATPLTMELTRGVGSSCNNVISQNFFPDRSSNLLSSGEFDFKFIDHCPAIDGIPESQNPEAISLPNEPTVLMTTESQAPVI